MEAFALFSEAFFFFPGKNLPTATDGKGAWGPAATGFLNHDQWRTFFSLFFFGLSLGRCLFFGWSHPTWITAN